MPPFTVFGISCSFRSTENVMTHRLDFTDHVQTFRIRQFHADFYGDGLIKLGKEIQDFLTAGKIQRNNCFAHKFSFSRFRVLLMISPFCAFERSRTGIYGSNRARPQQVAPGGAVFDRLYCIESCLKMTKNPAFVRKRAFLLFVSPQKRSRQSTGFFVFKRLSFSEALCQWLPLTEFRRYLARAAGSSSIMRGHCPRIDQIFAADFHSACACVQEFQNIFGACNAAAADDWNVYSLCTKVDRTDGDRLNRRSGKTACDVAKQAVLRCADRCASPERY